MGKEKGRAVKRIYVSGPITSIGISRAKEVFGRVKEDLERRGFEAVTPFENGIDEAEPYETHMKADIELLKTCDSICMLPGWQQSDGAKREYVEAFNSGKTIIEIVNVRK